MVLIRAALDVIVLDAQCYPAVQVNTEAVNLHPAVAAAFVDIHHFRRVVFRGEHLILMNSYTCEFASRDA